ncbi:MAG: transcriptional regulator [Omnitrophica bacterium RIFCSPLOWO2_12_FULL_50_11]|nr:MAG: transcriptional regulator [Omnitrophica bacterium RIFCSPLOWO2_12_FULL_50_11]
MSGHSKWASIKHKKALVDAKRGKMFTKVIREISVAARLGGGDVDTNPRLRLAVHSAKDVNMPAENIERAIKKGTGSLEGVHYEEAVYEGYGPSGVAIYVQCLTDNKNRTAGEIRNIFSKKYGNMAGHGSVAWLFEKKGFLVVRDDQAGEDQLMEPVLNAGAEDLSRSGNRFEILTAPNDFEAVKKALDQAEITYESADLQMIPKKMVSVSSKEARNVIALIEALEYHDDVQHVYTNCDIPDEVMKEVA